MGRGGGWKDGSVVKNEYSFGRGPEFVPSTHASWLTTLLKQQLQEDLVPSLDFTGTAGTCAQPTPYPQHVHII